MKKIISFLVVGLMLFSAVFALAGCAGEGGENVTENKDNNTNILNNAKNEHLATIFINGIEFNYPCTLKDLDANGVGGLIPSETRDILLNAENERFGAETLNVSVSCAFEAKDASYIGTEKVNLVSVFTTDATKEEFSLNGKVFIDSTIDDAIDELGEDYEVIGAKDVNNIYSGLVRINYTKNNEYIIIDAQDGIITFIEYGTDWSVE